MLEKTQNIREVCPRLALEASHPLRMEIFHCFCGEDILIVPDVKAMNKALKNHLTRHPGQHLTEETLVREMLKQIANRYFKLGDS